MGPAASGGPPRDNQPRRTPRRLFFLRLDSSSASLVYPHSAFGQTTKGHQILRSSFASRHAPLNLRVPSASSTRFSRRPTCSSPVLGFNARAAWPSRTFSVQSEGQPRTIIFFALLHFNARAAWSSRTFDLQTEGGVPNISFKLYQSDLSINDLNHATIFQI